MQTILRCLLLSGLAFSAHAFDFTRPATGTLVFVTQTDCFYCERLEREVLQPMRASGVFEGPIRFVEVSLDAGARGIDYNGTAISGSAFAERYGAYGTPTLLFLNDQGELTDAPWFGVPDALDFYGAKIEKAVAKLGQDFYQPH